MDWHKILSDVWSHLSPFVCLAAAYLIMMLWKMFWQHQHDCAKAALVLQDSMLQRARLLLADAMLRVEESEAKQIRELPGGITPEKGKQLLDDAWKLAQAEVRPLVNGVVKDAEAWAKSVIMAELAKWKEVKKLPFGIPSPTLNITPSLQQASEVGKGQGKAAGS